MGSVPKGLVPVNVVRCTSRAVVTLASAARLKPSVVDEHLSGNDAPLLAGLGVTSTKHLAVSATP